MRRIHFIVFLLIFGMIVYSCGEKTPVPAAVISASIDANVVKFSVEATDAYNYEWDFGDGSPVSTDVSPEHLYPAFDKQYEVSLTVTGPGGQVTFTYIVVIPPATMMQSLAGGTYNKDGRRWHMSPDSPARLVIPDQSLTPAGEWPAGKFTILGFSSIYKDEYLFTDEGDFEIIPGSNGVPAGLQYCISRGISNIPPCDQAAEKGFTLITPYTPPQGLSYGLNESKDLTISVSNDGITVSEVTYCNVSTLTFSRGAFIGILDWHTECIVTELTTSEMELILFFSDIPAGQPQTGKINKGLIIRFQASN